MEHEERHPLAAQFERFAKICARQGSPFYERLSRVVARDAELLDLAAHAVREPVSNVFFGAAHYLLLKGADHELREYFPSLADAPRADPAGPAGPAGPAYIGLSRAFTSFCSRFRSEIVELVRSRLVQTNEVSRCAVLAPAFSVVHELGERAPLALVEVGASAGLNLSWDRYRIGYSDGTVLGEPRSSVHIECENRGAALPTTGAPTVAERRGLDLNPIDLADVDEQLWLRALVWPDHFQRAERLEAAIALASDCPRSLLRGDALRVLPGILAESPRDASLCVYHSSVLYQFTPEQKVQFTELLAEASSERPVWQVSAESEEGLHLISYRGGAVAEKRFLGAFDAHGRWLDWVR